MPYIPANGRVALPYYHNTFIYYPGIYAPYREISTPDEGECNDNYQP